MTVDRDDETSLDRATFEEILVDLLPQLAQLARHLAGEGIEAKDLVQETCRRAIEARAQFRRGTNAGAWLCRILQNIFRDNRRKKRHEVSIDAVAIEARPVEPIALWRRVSDEDFSLALESLPETHRTMYRRHAIHGEPYDIIARDLGIPPATVGVRLWRARTKLRALLRQRLQAGESPDPGSTASAIIHPRERRR